MRVMVLIKANEKSEAGVMPGERLLTEMGEFNEELIKAGVMLGGEGLHPSSKGRRVRLGRGQPVVIDGPFAETKELLAGYWIWKIESMDEAIRWAGRIPNPEKEEFEIELRPVFETCDFGAELTPEARAREERHRAELERRK